MSAAVCILSDAAAWFAETALQGLAPLWYGRRSAMSAYLTSGGPGLEMSSADLQRNVQKLCAVPIISSDCQCIGCYHPLNLSTPLR